VAEAAAREVDIWL